MQKAAKRAIGAVVVSLVLTLGQGICIRAQEQTTAEQDLERGRVMYTDGNFQGAIDVLKQALSKKADLAEARYLVGVCYYMMRDFAQAEPALREALKLKSDNYAQAHYYLGMSRYRQRDVDTAVREFHTAIEQRKGNYPEAYNVLGVIQYSQKDYAEAIKSFRKSVEEKTDSPQLNASYAFNLGMAIENEITKGAGDSPSVTWNDAISAYRQAIEQMARYPLARKALGLALIGTDNQGAITELETFLQQAPRSAERLQVEEVIELLKKPDDPAAQPEDISKIARVSKAPTPRPTEEAIKQKVEGSVIVSTIFCYDKQVRVVKVVKGLGHGLDESAIEAVRKIQFEPSQVNGSAMSERHLVKIDFKI
jgi:TonB family protein